ncbi:MAG TPA: hypothetical protein VK172_09025 [Lentimicrobium sp.]|nr:hypothetical protein [Lentimicrobium sp.]
MKHCALFLLLLLTAFRVAGQNRELYSGEWKIDEPFNCTGRASYAYYKNFSSDKKILDRGFSIIYSDKLNRLKITVTGSFADNARDGKWQMDFDFNDYPYGDDGLLSGFVHINQGFSKGIPHGEWVSAERLAITGTGPSPRPSSLTEENLSLTFNQGIVTGKVIYTASQDDINQLWSIAADSLGYMHGHWVNDYDDFAVVSTYSHGLPVRIVQVDHASGDSTVKLYASDYQMRDWKTAFPIFTTNPYLCSLMYETFTNRYDRMDSIINQMFCNDVVTALHIPGEVRWDKEKNFKIVFLYQERSGAEDQIKVGDYYLKHSDTTSATEWYQRAADEHPDNGNAYFKIAQLAEAGGDTYNVLLNYSKASLTNHPEADKAIVSYGIKLMKEGANDASKETFRLLTLLKPQNANAWDGLGWTFLETDSIPQALVAFEQAENLSPCADSFTGKLLCLFLSGNKKQARQYYATAKTLYPFIYPAKNLITGLIIQGNFYTDKQLRLIEAMESEF